MATSKEKKKTATSPSLVKSRLLISLEWPSAMSIMNELYIKVKLEKNTAVESFLSFKFTLLQHLVHREPSDCAFAKDVRIIEIFLFCKSREVLQMAVPIINFKARLHKQFFTRNSVQ